MGTSAKLVSAARTPAVGPGARGTREVRDRTLEITVFLHIAATDSALALAEVK